MASITNRKGKYYVVYWFDSFDGKRKQKWEQCENYEEAIFKKKKIEDEVNRNYAVLKLKNLHESGIQVTLEFDPKKVRLDLNDEIYINKISSETTQIDGNDYIKKLVFNMDAEAVKYVKFYKVDMSQSYKYPAGAASSVIKVTI